MFNFINGSDDATASNNQSQQSNIIYHHMITEYITISVNNQYGEESSWIPPTCFPASTDVSTIPIPLQYGIIAVYGFNKYYPLTNGAIGSHPLYEAGNQTIQYIHMPICIYCYIYRYISYYI